jgi:hypothetical protein
MSYSSTCTLHTFVSVVIDGNWGAWTTVSSCSATCGAGKSLKTRQCDNPAPSNGGNVCSGDAAVLSTCVLANCTAASGSNSNGGAYVNVRITFLIIYIYKYILLSPSKQKYGV